MLSCSVPSVFSVVRFNPFGHKSFRLAPSQTVERKNQAHFTTALGRSPTSPPQPTEGLPDSTGPPIPTSAGRKHRTAGALESRSVISVTRSRPIFALLSNRDLARERSCLSRGIHATQPAVVQSRGSLIRVVPSFTSRPVTLGIGQSFPIDWSLSRTAVLDQIKGCLFTPMCANIKTSSTGLGQESPSGLRLPASASGAC